MTHLLARFQRDEQGSAMTEFVVTLPLFIMIFIGVSDLGRLWDTVISTQNQGIKSTWQAAIDTQKNPLAITASYPWIAGPMAVASAANYDQNTFATVNDAIMQGGVTVLGSFGESAAHLAVMGLIANTPPAHTSPAPFGGTAAVQDMWEERFPKPIAMNAYFAPFAPAFAAAAIGPRPVVAAGYRYGLAADDASNSVNLTFGGNQTFEFGYTVRNAPLSLGLIPPNFGPPPIAGLSGGILTTGTSRLGLHQHRHYENLLGISFGNRL